MWQDIVMTITQVVFAYGIIPQVLQGFKNKKGYINLQTGVLTFLGTYAMAIVFFSLGLLFSTIIAIFNGTMWLILTLQKIFYKKA